MVAECKTWPGGYGRAATEGRPHIYDKGIELL